MTTTASPSGKPDTGAAPHPHTVSAADPAGTTKLPPVVWLLGAVAFLMGTTELVVAGLLPEISTALGVSVAHAGLLITVFAIGMMLGAPAMAMATLRLPHRSTLITALLVFAAGHIAGALSPTFAIALIGRFAAALGTGTFWAVGAVVATAAAGPAASTRAMGVMIGGVTLANIVGVPLGTAGGQLLGWQGPFWVLAVLSLIATVVIARQLPADKGGSDTSVRAELCSVKHIRLWLVYLAIALVQGAVLATYSYVAPLLTERAELPQALVPLAMLGYGAGALAGTTFAGRRGDSRPYVTAIPAAAVTAVMLGAITLWATNSIAAVILIVLLGAAGIMTNPILVGEVVRIAGPGRALPMALATSAFNVGIAAGSWIGGIALTSSLGLRGPSLAGFFLALVALLPLGILAASRRNTGGLDDGRTLVLDHFQCRGDGGSPQARS
ncbi:MFS transporter [Streptomyces arenae]|uniref:MFS transporter n=1 Tax=Streptomyces arenae TaxID=29301 RepID=UPI0026594393|nr:MFS transporter [Streptomyces arenae]MCG7202271.1 MFS transporter [Streptomyces arenae]